MGLDTTHDAFHGAYSAFNRFRQAVCKCVGGSYPPHDEEAAGRLDPGRWYVPGGVTAETHPGLYAFMNHSDCDGELTAAECGQVADDLEPLLPLIDATYPATGHIERDGGFRAVLQRFIDGCRRAAAAGEAMEFH